MHCLCSSCHRLEEKVLSGTSSDVILGPCKLSVVGLACAVDISLACCRSHTDAGILKYATKATHSMAFEMGKINHEIIVGKMTTHNVILEVFFILNRYSNLIILVHDIDSKD